jgi:hypothetical protein
LLAEHYSEIPLLSVAWGMGHIGLPFAEDGRIHILGMALPLGPDSTFLASVHWAGAIKLRIEEIADTDTTAASQAANLSLLLDLARGATLGLGPNTANNSLKEALRTAQISQQRNRVVASATLPQSLPIDLLNGGASTPGN